MVTSTPPTPALPDKLFESARKEFLAYGFADANVGRIAAAAGMSKKTIYKYVPSKEALFLALVESVLHGSRLMLDGLDPQAAPAVRLTACLEAFAQLAFSEEGITSYRLVMSEGIRFPEMARSYIDTINRYSVPILANELTAFAATRHRSIGDPTFAAKMLLAMVIAEPLRDAALGIALPPTGAAFDERLASAVGIFLNGVGRTS